MNYLSLQSVSQSATAFVNQERSKHAKQWTNRDTHMQKYADNIEWETLFPYILLTTHNSIQKTIHYTNKQDTTSALRNFTRQGADVCAYHLYINNPRKEVSVKLMWMQLHMHLLSSESPKVKKNFALPENLPTQLHFCPSKLKITYRWRRKTMLKISAKQPGSLWQLARTLLVLQFHTYTSYTQTNIKERV